MISRGTVLLYSPHFAPPQSQSGAEYLATPPLSMLALGGPLQQRGYDARLIDAKWSPDPSAEVRELAPKAVAIAITCLTGYAVRDGLAAARAAREANREIAIIWGGWHPTFAAEQAAQDPLVDIVVRGQGERTLCDVLDAIVEQRTLRSIPGVTYREGNEIVSTPDRPAEDLNQFPPPAYDLVDARHYVSVGRRGIRHANTIFSRGCPYSCDFCLDSRKKWFGLSIDRMEREIRFWVENHAVNNMRFYDGNFFLGRARIEEICHMLTRTGLAERLRWVATGVANRMAQMDDELLTLLRKAGCSQVAIGAESGSEELLQQITNKTTVEMTTEAVRRLTRHGINQYLFFMVGFPAEPPDALEQTLSLICRLKAINPEIQLFINFCVPLPGSEMFRVAVEKGYMVPPSTFEEWAGLDQTGPNLPHISRRYELTVKRFLSYLAFAYPTIGSRLASLDRYGLLWPLRQVARWRVQNRFFSVPVELLLHDSLRKSWRPPAKLSTTPLTQ